MIADVEDLAHLGKDKLICATFSMADIRPDGPGGPEHQTYMSSWTEEYVRVSFSGVSPSHKPEKLKYLYANGPDINDLRDKVFTRDKTGDPEFYIFGVWQKSQYIRRLASNLLYDGNGVSADHYIQIIVP